MNDFFDSFAYWLADYYLATTVLLAAALVAIRLCRQPVKRLAVAKATIVAMAVLAGLCALPDWSAISLVTSEATQDVAPVTLDPVAPTTTPQRLVPIAIARPEPVFIRPPERAVESVPLVRGQFSWRTIALVAYFSGSAVVVCWLLLGSIAALRLVQRAHSAPASFREMLNRSGSNRARRVQLLVSDEIDVAVALGVWRPRVIVPSAWASRRSPAELSTVLAHEVAHIENGDLVWLAFSRLMLVVAWAQPLYLMLRHTVRLDQEALADAAAAQLSDRHRYAEQLVAWARELAARRRLSLPAAMGLWEGPSQLRRRIALLVDEQFTLLANCPAGWRRGALLAVVVGAVSLSQLTLEPGHSAPLTSKPAELSGDQAAKVAAAILVLRETEGIGERPVAGSPVADDWAAAIRTLAEIGQPAVPVLIASLDDEQRDHPISKLAFTLRAIGDPRAVPALIRAIPRTLVPSRSDFGLRIADPELLKFMQQHDLTRSNGGDDFFDYGRSFREVVGALEKLTGTNQNDMELNWVHLGETEPQRQIQRRLFHQLAEKWADWWTEHWKQFGVDESFAVVDLPPLVESATTQPATSPPSGEKLGLSQGHSEWIVEPARESGQRCFVDLDTSRQGDWPKELDRVGELGAASERAKQWAQEQGFDLVGIRYQPAGYESPLYCLQPIDLKVWEISPEEQSQLMRSMRGQIPYPLGRPVDLIAPRKQEYEGPDKNELGGSAFLFLTRAGTAGLLRMTAQVTDTKFQLGKIHSSDDQYSPIGFYRGAKISFSVIAETDTPQEVAGGDRLDLDFWAAPGGPPQAPMQPQRLGERGAADAVLPQESNEAATKDASGSTADGATQHTVSGGGTTATFVAGNPATPWDFKPNVLVLAVQDEAGKPLEGVEAVVYRVAPQSGERVLVKRSTTDAEGAVEFNGLVDAERAAEFQARAAKSQFPLVQGDIFYTVLKRPGLATVILPRSDFTLAGRGVKHGVRMRPAAELVGRVTDREGKPVEGATVAAGSIAGFFVLDGANAVKTDAEGRYRFSDRVAFNREAASKRIAEQNQWSLAADRDMSKMYPAVYDPAEDTSVSDLCVTHPDFAVTTVRGGDVPGTTNIVMAPSAAIEGRVVEFGTGKPSAGVQVKAAGAPIPIDAEVLNAANNGGTRLFVNDVHSATTRTDASGRYRMSNLPAGKYDVWAEAPLGDAGRASWVVHGLEDIEATAGNASAAAPDLVIGPGGLVHGQLIDGGTGKPLSFAGGGGLALVTSLFVDPMQQQLPLQQVPVTADGKFDMRLPPGKVRVILSVQKSRDALEPQGDFRSSDDSYQSGPLFDMAHGESTNADFVVSSRAQIEAKRSAVTRGFKLLSDQKYDESVAVFTAMIAEDPHDRNALIGRAQAYEQSGRYAQAVTDYEALIRPPKGDPGFKSRLVELLSSSPDASVRNGRRAVELATQVLDATRRNPPNEYAITFALMQLAAAQAEAGDFDAAVATQREAIEASAESVRDSLRDRLKLYEAGKPYRREIPPPPN